MKIEKCYSNDDLMFLESDKKILDYKNRDGTPWWFYIRYDFLFGFLSQKLGIRQELSFHRQVNFSGIKFIFKSIMHDMLHSYDKSASIAFYVTSRPLKNTENKKYYNRYADPFYELYPHNTVVYENAPLDWQWYSPRLYNNYRFYTFNLVKSRLVSKFFTRIPPELSDLLSYLSDRSKDFFDFELSEEMKLYFKKIALSNYKTYSSHFSWFIRKLKQHHTKLVIVSGASYSHYCDLNKLAHKEGIIVADMQHGAICSSNILYTYARNILDSEELKAIIPDYYLSYGAWWNEQVNIPYKKIVIGNPLRKLLLHNINHEECKNKILIVGSANHTKQYLALTSFLTRQNMQLQVVFRPHPTEIRDAITFAEDFPDVTIDYGMNLYQQLFECYAVISEISTVLFEAVALAERIIVWRTQYSKNNFPVSPFPTFETKEQLLQLLKKKEFIYTYKNDDFWSEDIRDNYLSFLKKSIGE